MPGSWISRLAPPGADPRGFWALARAFILMDLRGQHYARATATRPHFPSFFPNVQNFG